MTIESKTTDPYLHKDKLFLFNYPNIDYDFGDRGYKTIKNFLHRFNFIKPIVNNVSAWSYWTIREKETPEVIAYKVYGNANLYWLPLVLNQISNPDFEWPMLDREVYGHAIQKYGAEAIYDEHHRESTAAAGLDDLPAGIIVDDNYTPYTSINNLTYEYLLNEDRREIKLLVPDYLPYVLAEFKNITDSQFTRARS